CRNPRELGPKSLLGARHRGAARAAGPQRLQHRLQLEKLEIYSFQASPSIWCNPAAIISCIYMQALDELLLRAVAELRSPLLTRIAMDITSLGSTTLILLQAAIAAVLLIVLAGNRRGAVQVGIAVAGAELWVQILKRLLHRARPIIVPALVEATGFSDP